MPSERITVGAYWRKRALGTEAVYKVVAVEGDRITVEVRQAPGLPTGAQMRFLAKAFREMDRIPPPAGE